MATYTPDANTVIFRGKHDFNSRAEATDSEFVRLVSLELLDFSSSDGYLLVKMYNREGKEEKYRGKRCQAEGDLIK